MKGFKEALNKVLDTIIYSLMVLSSAILFLVTLAQVISRFVFQMPIPWSTDIIRLTFVYSVFFGAAYTAKNNDHLNLDVVLDLLKPRTRRFVNALTFLLLTVFCLFLAYIGWQFTMKSGLVQRLPYLKLPMTVMYISIPIGGAAMAFYYAQYAVRDFRALFSDAPDKK